MSIEKTSNFPAGLQEPPAVSGKSSTSSSKGQGTSFQQIMSRDAEAAPPPELTALQLLFRCPPSTPTVPVAPPTTGGSNPGPDGTISGTGSGIPPPPQEPLDPSPAAPWPTTAIRPYPTPELAGQTKSAVLAALKKDGIEPSTVKISYWEELVNYPGGSYTNKNITVQTASGRKIDLDAAYMLRCPWLAASAVKDLDTVAT